MEEKKKRTELNLGDAALKGKADKKDHEEDKRGVISIEGSKAAQCCGKPKDGAMRRARPGRKLLESCGDP